MCELKGTTLPAGLRTFSKVPESQKQKPRGVHAPSRKLLNVPPSSPPNNLVLNGVCFQFSLVRRKSPSDDDDENDDK